MNCASTSIVGLAKLGSDHSGGLSCAVAATSSDLCSTLFASGGKERQLNVYKGEITTPIFCAKAAAECLRFDRNVESLVFGTVTGALKIVDLATQKVLPSFKRSHKGPVTCLTQSPRDHYLWTSGSLDSTIHIWDTRSSDPVGHLQHHGKTVSVIEFSPDGAFFASGSEDCSIALFDVTATKVRSSISAAHSSTVTDIKCHPVEYLMASSSDDKTIRFRDLESFECVSQSDAVGSSVEQLAFYPLDESCSTLLALSRRDLRLCTWEPYSLLAVVPLFRDNEQNDASAFRPFSMVVEEWSKKALILGTRDNSAVDVLSLLLEDCWPRSRNWLAKKPELVEVGANSDTEGRSSSSSPTKKRRSFSIELAPAADDGLSRSVSPSSSAVSSPVGSPRRLGGLSSTGTASSSTTAMPLKKTFSPGAASSLRKKSSSVSSTSRQASPAAPLNETQAFAARPKLRRSPPMGRKTKKGGGKTRIGGNNRNSLISPSSSTPMITFTNSTPKREDMVNTKTFVIHQSGSNSKLLTQFECSNSASSSASSGTHRSSRRGRSNSPKTPVPATGKPAPPCPNSQQLPASNGPNTSSPSGKPPPPQLAVSPIVEEGQQQQTNCFFGGAPTRAHSQQRGQRVAAIPPQPQRKQSNAMMNVTAPLPGATGVFFGAEPPAQELFNQSEGDLNPSDFLPSTFSSFGLDTLNACSSSTSQVGLEPTDCLKAVNSQRDAMKAVFEHRVASAQAIQRIWHSKGLRRASVVAVGTNNDGLVIDLLDVLNNNSRLWSLALCATFLPELGRIIESPKEKSYVEKALRSLQIIVTGFGGVISNGVSAGPTPAIGVDVSQEERYDNCRQCQQQLCRIKNKVDELAKTSVAFGQHFRELSRQIALF